MRDGATAYARAVVAGKVVVGRLVLLACRRHLADLAAARRKAYPWRFDRVEAQAAIEFFPLLLRHLKGEWAGKPVVLEPWQQFVVGCVFGWRAKKTGLRRFRQAFVEVARKNGKSTLAAGIALLLAFFEREPGAEVYCAATKKDQAKIVWGAAAEMVKRSPALSKRIRVLVNNLHSLKTGSKLEPLGADLDSLDGLNPSGAIVDELHAHRDGRLLDVLETGLGSRRQPLLFEITTAGFDRTSVCWRDHKHSVAVLEGTATDDAWFAYVAALDKGDDWRDPKVWIKANPNLGVSCSVAYLQQQVDRAVQVPGRQQAVRRLNFDEWTEQASTWIDMTKYDALPADPITLAGLRGRSCYGGLDLASTADLCAFVLVFPPTLEEQREAAGLPEEVEAGEEQEAEGEPAPEEGDDGSWPWGYEEDAQGADQAPAEEQAKPESVVADEGPVVRLAPGLWRALAWYWIPEVRVEERKKSAGVPYPEWADLGLLRKTPGNVADYDWIKAGIREIAEVVKIKEIAFDRWNAVSIVTDLSKEGATMVPFGQGFASMNLPMQQFERLVLGGQFRHGGNPVLRWNFANLVAEADAAGNLKPSRRKSQEKIDGAVALMMALGRAVVAPPDDGESVYSERGIVSV